MPKHRVDAAGAIYLQDRVYIAGNGSNKTGGFIFNGRSASVMAARTYFGTALSLFCGFYVRFVSKHLRGRRIKRVSFIFLADISASCLSFIAERRRFENADYAVSAFTAAAILTAAQSFYFVLFPLFFLLTR